MKGLNIIMSFCIIVLIGIHSIVISSRNTEYLSDKVENYQTTVDSLIQKNERLNNRLIDVWDENANKNIQIYKLEKDNKFLNYRLNKR